MLGQILFTVTPWVAHSAAAALVKLITPPLAA